jgi:hypothetical protein
MTEFVATYDGNGGERKARVQSVRRGDGGCARGQVTVRGTGGDDDCTWGPLMCGWRGSWQTEMVG